MSVVKKKSKIMKDDLLSCLQLFIKNNGKDALDDVKITGNFIYTNTAVEYMPECEALMICIILGYHKKIICANGQERSSVKKDIVEYLNNDEGLNKNICNKTLDILEAALFEMEIPMEKIKSESETAQEEELKKIIDELSKEKQLAMDNETTIRRLETIVADTEKQNRNLINENNSLKNQKAKKKSKTFIFLFIITIVTLFIVYSYMSYENMELSSQKERVYNEYMASEENFENSKKIWTINVVGMKVGNANEYNKWITQPGVQLKASEVRYLNPVFVYNSPTTCSMAFFIKIMDPNGEILINNNSPDGYSYSRQYQIRKGNSIEFDPNGYGNAGGGIFYPGTWKIELWSEGFCLYSGEIILE
jgi:hypothetical protein